MAFTFSKESADFLKGLEQNNDKEWFDVHRDTYQKYVKKEAEEFAATVGEELKKISSKINVEPRVNRSIFRLNRDVRFSKDKTPYKTHLGFFFWEGPAGRKEDPGFYLMIKPDEVLVGVGLYKFSKHMLDQYREAITEDMSGQQFTQIIHELQKNGYEIGNKHYKRVPRGYDEDDLNSEFLKYNALHAGKTLPGIKMTSKDLLKHISSEAQELKKLHRWLVDEVAMNVSKN